MSAGKIDGLKGCFYNSKLFGQGELKTVQGALTALTKKLKGKTGNIADATIRRFITTIVDKMSGDRKKDELFKTKEFKDLFLQLITETRFKDVLFGDADTLKSLPDDILIKLSSQKSYDDSHLLTLFKVLRAKVAEESDQELETSSVESNLKNAFENFIDLCKPDQLVHLSSSLSGCDINYGKLSERYLKTFLKDVSFTPESGDNTTQAKRSTQEPRTVLASGRFTSTVIFLPQVDSGTSTDDNSLTEIVRDGEGFSSGVNFSLSKAPIKQLSENSYVIYPSEPGKFELAVSDDCNKTQIYPLSRGQDGRWTVVGCPLDFFVPLPTPAPLALSGAQKMDYDFNVGKGEDKFSFAFNTRIGGENKWLQVYSLANALKLANRLLLAKTSEMSPDVFSNFHLELLTQTELASFSRGAKHYDFLIYPSGNLQGKYEVTYKASEDGVELYKIVEFDTLKDAASFAERLLIAKEIDPEGVLPPILLKFIGEKSSGFSVSILSLDPGELVVYRDRDQKHKIAVKELDGLTTHIYGLEGDFVQTAQKLTSNGFSSETQAKQSLKDVLEYHALRDPLLEERNKHNDPKLHPHPRFKNLATKREGDFDRTVEKHSMTKIADIVVGDRTLPFIASSDPTLVKGNAKSFYDGINLGQPVAVIKLNVGQTDTYFPDNVGETRNVEGVNVTTIQRRDYSFNNLDKIQYDSSAYPGLDLSKLKIQVRELTFEGEKEGQTTFHISVAGWPDHEGLPPQILQAIRDQIKVILQEYRIHFVFTHCRAGVGRTGTLAAALSLPDTYDSSKLQNKITDMRENRSHMVQDLMQYVCLREMGELAYDNPITFDCQDFSPPRPPKPSDVPAYSLKGNSLIFPDGTTQEIGKAFAISGPMVADRKCVLYNSLDETYPDLWLAYADQDGNVGYVSLSPAGMVNLGDDSGEQTLGAFLKKYKLELVVHEGLGKSRISEPERLTEIDKIPVDNLCDNKRDAETKLNKKGAVPFLIRKSAKGYVLSFYDLTHQPPQFQHLTLENKDGSWTVNLSDDTWTPLNTFLKSKGLLPNTENIPGKGAAVKRPKGVVNVTTKGKLVLGTGTYGAVKRGTAIVTDTDMIDFITQSGIEFKETTYDGKNALEISDGLVVKKIELQNLTLDIATLTQGTDYVIEDNKIILTCSLSEVQLKTKFGEFSRLSSEEAIKSSSESVKLEAEMGMRFDHPNLGRTVAVSDVYQGKLHCTTKDRKRYQVWAKGEDDTFVPVTTAKMFMLQQRIAGQELFDVVFTSRPSDEEKMKWFFQILAGVQHMHENDCVHRDLKLDNVMINEAGNAVVMDFGFTRELGHPDFQRDQCTPGYAAPEVLNVLKEAIALEDAHKVDSFALATLGEMLFFQSQRNSRNFPIYFGDQDFILKTFKDYVERLPEGPLKKIGEILINLGHPDPKQRLSVADCIAAIKADDTLCRQFSAALVASTNPPPPVPPKS